MRKFYMKQIFKRGLSLAMSAILLFQTVIYFPVKAASFAEGSGTVALGSSAIAYSQKLTDNGDGTYTLTLTLKDASYVSDVNTDDTVSRNHYFTAPANGDYLIELWGGNGGSGSNNGSVPGGNGGKGGHVYGLVTLKKGETLYYQLGGNGNATLKSDEGGGINGDGGASGGISNYSIGGGGGYSAIYKFAPGEFETAYLDSEGNMTVDNISESDRVSKFIAIAAGGGGGGAGSIGSEGILGTGWLTDRGNPPNGGDGGSMESMSVAVDGGTVYVGGDGSTSGTSTAYVGLGGTDVPATYADSISTLFDTVQANDWYAVTNTDLAGGAGGSGNLRGGGGGAGYAGGGGGIQESILRAAHVGGGGGGSSYLSDEVSAPTAAQIAAMGDKADGGGAIRITPVAGVVSNELKGVTLTITPSKYFAISTTGLADGGTLDITDTAQTIEILFTPISGFAGGNNVPLLENNAIPCVNGEGTECSIPLKADCAAVNVPLDFAVVAQSKMTNQAGTAFNVDELYQDNYSAIRGNLTSGDDAWKYDFISSISEYAVKDSAGNQITTETVAPTSTSKYTVYFTVVPKLGTAAVVGQAVTTTKFEAVATITILPPGTGPLGGNTLSYQKELSYNSTNKTYTLTLTTDVTSKTMSVEQVGSITFGDEDSDKDGGSYIIPADGYYYIQAWGGDGGSGSSVTPSSTTYSGGSGGSGGYLGQYIYCHDGDELKIVVGSNGTSSQSVTENVDNVTRYFYGAAGGAGNATTVIILRKGADGTTISTGIMSAAGGGGGDGAYGQRRLFGILGSSGTKGLNGNSVSNNSVDFADSFAGVSVASPGSDGASADDKSSAAGTNFLDTTLMGKEEPGVSLTETEQLSRFSANDYTNTGNGAVTITCLQVDTTKQGSIPENYSFLSRIAKYWDVLDCTVKGMDGNEIVTDAANKTVQGTTTIDPNDSESGFADCTLIKVEHFSPGYQAELITDANGNPLTEYTSKITVIIDLKPKAAFLGGNNVSILVCEPADSGAASPILYGMQLKQTEPSNGAGDDTLNLDVPSKEVTDYANVEISYTASRSDIREGDEADRTIDQASSELYVYKDKLYNWNTNKPVLYDANGNKYWYADYVELVETVVKTENGVEETGDTITPDPLVTTPYTVTVGLAPTVKDPTAIFTAPVGAVTVSKDIEVIVLPRIQHDLANLIMSGTDAAQNGYEVTGTGSVTITSGTDHTATLRAAAGYRLPDSIVVTAADGTDISDLVGYNPTTGKFTIPARYAVGTITVSAEAPEETYSITVYYPSGVGYGSAVYGPYSEGTDISGVESLFPAMADQPGHTFVWDWGDFSGTTMPNRDLTVIGSYVANKYTLTVHHYKEGTTDPLAGDETFEVAYGSAQTVTAKEITGWLASAANATVTMDSVGGKEYTFYYTATSGQLNITYLFANGTEAHEKHTQSISTDQAYSVTSPVIDGYTADIIEVSGTATGTDAENGINITVTYTPNRYTVAFDPSGGSVSITARPVEFGSIYCYAPETGTYPGLPTPVWPGHDFNGWYLNGAEVTESTIVATAEDHILIAQWEAKELTATVRYIYEDGTLIPAATLEITANPATQTGTTGQSYSFTSPALAGHSPDQTVVEGTFGTTSPTPVTVTYVKLKVYTLTVIAKSDDGIITHTTNMPVTAGNTYEVNVTEFDSFFDPNVYERAPGIGDIINGIMPASDKVIYIDYLTKGAAEVISVTVTWGTLLFDYNYGMWQPTNHTYAEDTIEVATNLSNTVTVSSDSNVVVNVGITYTPRDGYTGISGFFTEGSDSYGSRISEWQLRNSESKTVYLWLEGTLERGKSENTYPCGDCTVTITGGG